MTGQKRAIELNIPKTAEERVKASSEWHCAGCGIPVPDLVKRCDCITMVACKDGHKSVWMIDPNDPPHIINLRGCQTQLDMDGCNVGVSRQALEETLADYARLRAEVARLTGELGEAREIIATKNRQEIAAEARAQSAEAERDQYRDDYFRRHKEAADNMERALSAEAEVERLKKLMRLM